jgi:HEAT repeat protein
VRPFTEDGLVVGGQLGKRKLGYRGASAGQHALQAEGNGQALLNPSIGWFEQAHWQESLRREVREIGVQSTSTMTAHWSLVDTGWREVGDGEALWNTAWQPVAGEPEGQAVDEMEAAHYAERLAGVRAEDLVQRLAQLLQPPAAEANAVFGVQLDLVWLLRLRPQELSRLQAMLPALDQASAKVVIDALGASELPAAQTLLAELFSDYSRASWTREAAAVAMMQVRAPQGSTVLAFAQSLLQTGVTDDGSTTGALALGMMVSRADASTQAAAAAALLGMEALVQRQGSVAEWLEALGNAGQPDVLAVASRYRAHASAMVRSAAVASMRLVPGDAAVQLMITGLQDAEPAVRARAARVLGMRTEPRAFAALSQMLDTEPDARVRAAGVRALAVRANDPAVAARLRQVAAADAADEVRSLAAGALTQP